MSKIKIPLYCESSDSVEHNSADDAYFAELQSFLSRFCIEMITQHDLQVPDEGGFVFNKYLSFKTKSHHYSFDWIKEYKTHIKKNYSLNKEPLARALGIKKSLTKHICDSSGGTGKDAILIYSFGSSVTIFERNPIVFCLLADAYLRFSRDLKSIDEEDDKPKIYLSFGQIEGITELNNFDAIYFDPMYPEKKKKSAKARKEMELFKEIVGVDEDYLDRLELLRGLHPYVVLKRPLSASPEPSPSHSISGKTTRYDVYKRI